MTATIIPLPLVNRERAEALDRIMGRAQRPPTITDWRFLQQHGASDGAPEQPLLRDDGAFDFGPGAA